MLPPPRWCWRAAVGSRRRADQAYRRTLEAVPVQASGAGKVEGCRESEADSLAEDSPGP